MSDKLASITHLFVEFMPDTFEAGVVYVSVAYKTMAHLCCCGCGSKVVTPISPTGWQLTYDGKTISISPSIGSWNLACQSHYWIRHGAVLWAEQWSKKKIEAGFARDERIKRDYYRDPSPSKAKRDKK